jgi:hypothetical protein
MLWNFQLLRKPIPTFEVKAVRFISMMRSACRCAEGGSILARPCDGVRLKTARTIQRESSMGSAFTFHKALNLLLICRLLFEVFLASELCTLKVGELFEANGEPYIKQIKSLCNFAKAFYLRKRLLMYF